jgi:Uma2 family endonuclease
MTVTAPREIQQPATPARRYLRPPEPKHFPVEEEVPETRRHLRLRTTLFDAVRRAFEDRACLGSEQFVYWDPTDPTQCCAPDLFVHVGEPDAEFDCWKTWERGAPQLAVEVISKSDARDRPWDAKLARYARLGVNELVRFDGDDTAQPLRIWDRVDGDLVERDPEGPGFSRCDTLDAFWCVRGAPLSGLDLRLSRDETGHDLFLTTEEHSHQETEARRLAEARARELEQQIAKLRR